MHFSPDSRYLASSSYDKTARLWRVEDGKEVAVLGEHPGWVFDVKFSASGALLATACADKLVRIYRIEEDREKDALRLSLTAELSEHSDWVTGVEFSNDEKYLASCGKDARIVVLQVGDWKRRSVLSGHRQWINQVSFSQDGKLLASAADDEQVIVWDLASEKPILKLRTNGGAFRAAFLPGGEALAVTDHKQIIFYPLDLEIGGGSPEGLLQEAENRAGMVLEAFELKAR